MSKHSYHPIICSLLYIVNLPNGKFLLRLPWCNTITGYQISSNNSNSQQQPTADYRQTSKLLPGVSQPTRAKTTTNRVCASKLK